MNGKELAMPDRGHVFRRAFSWLPAQFASQSDAPVGAPRQFGSTEHLSVEAIAAFVDGELRMNAHLRAAHHLSQCAQCAAEVDDQSRARAALRDSRPIRIPANLLGMLAEIPLRVARHPRPFGGPRRPRPAPASVASCRPARSRRPPVRRGY
ncbi:RNA polymerase subunit sigma-70 [Mycobacterium avium subsp. paratuberculosis 10-5975]|nr:RNA polymerase subunit sigma-70 [Mycobacterium avium subsp. paratuberculosis 10-5975]